MTFEFSESIKLVLDDGDEVWPTTMSGSYRLITSRKGHNILHKGEKPVTEQQMIDGVLNKRLPSRWRSKTNKKRRTPNHFSIDSPSVQAVYVKVGGVWIDFSPGK